MGEWGDVLGEGGAKGVISHVKLSVAMRVTGWWGWGSSLKGRETAIVNQTNTGIVSTAALGKLLTDRMERIWPLPNACMPF